MSSQITITNLSSTTTKDSLEKFLGFCGKITNITINGSTAHVTFEQEKSAEKALFLNGGNLDGANLHISHDGANDGQSATTAHPSTAGGNHIEQHDKPAAGIAAEMLATGYGLSDTIVQRAIEVDQNQGISTRFLSFFNSLDSTIGQKIGGPEATVSGQAKATLATGQQRAVALDEQHGVSRQATAYYSSAISSPFGQQVLAFYTQTAKQVQDVHEEAKRIAQAEKEKQQQQGTAAGGASAAPAATT